jgi:hypothetical protein
MLCCCYGLVFMVYLVTGRELCYEPFSLQSTRAETDDTASSCRSWMDSVCTF